MDTELKAHAQEAVIHGSSGKALKVDADILLVPLKCSNAKILQFFGAPLQSKAQPWWTHK